MIAVLACAVLAAVHDIADEDKIGVRLADFRQLVHQLGQQVAAVSDNVAVMQGNGFCLALRQNIAEAVPDVAALAELLWFKADS